MECMIPCKGHPHPRRSFALGSAREDLTFSSQLEATLELKSDASGRVPRKGQRLEKSGASFFQTRRSKWGLSEENDVG